MTPDKAMKKTKTTKKGTSTKKRKGSSSAIAAPTGDKKENVRSYLYTMHRMGIPQVEESEILFQTGYKRTDSTGYRVLMKDLIKQMRHVERNKGHLALTDAGIAYQESHGGIQIPVQAVTMQDNQAQLKDMILQKVQAPEAKLDAIWNILIDGHKHEPAELLDAAGYKRPDSTGYRDIMKWLKKLQLVTKEETAFLFTDKVYKYGSRPIDI
eukprot:scaffold1815_cov208-Amphora_coffeaeformis.AAC.11